MRGSVDNVTLVVMVAVLLGAPTASRASTVIPMSLQTMADHAGQVIVGTVVASRSYRIDNPRGIETEITLEGVEYLKGERPDSPSRFTLRLPGGTVGDRQMRVCCAPVPAIGEKWLLFLLPEYKTYPTVGLYQGAFRIVADAKGVERVYRALNEPVTGFDGGGWVRISGARSRHNHDRLVATNRVRVVELEPTQPAAGPMSLAEFRTVLEPVLAASKRHSLTAPAGRRIPTRYRAVPFRRANDPPANARPDSARHQRRLADTNKESGEPRPTTLERR